MMFKATIQVDADVLEEIIRTTEQAPREMRKAVGLIARGPIAQAIIVELAREPGPSRQPVLWASDRQRKYVMGRLRREGNLPYRRSHVASRGWRVVLNTLASAGENGGVITVENSTRGIEYISGELQSRQNAATGWPLSRLVIREFEPVLESELIDAWWRVNGLRK